MINRADVHLTYRCNLSCPSCNRACFSKLKQAPDLDIEPFQRFLEESKMLGMEYEVLMVGGEPTLHDNLLEFIRLTTEAGRKSSIHTNAYSPRSKEALQEVAKTSCVICPLGFAPTPLPNKYFTNDTTFISPADMGFERDGPCDVWYTCGGFSVDSLGYTPCSIGGMIANLMCPSARTMNLADLLDERYVKFALKEICRHCGSLYRYSTGRAPQGLFDLFGNSDSPDTIWTRFIESVDTSRIPSNDLYDFVSPDAQHGESVTRMTKTWFDAFAAAKRREDGETRHISIVANAAG